jgi:predicted nucleic acid binding AN1-type Zn finger protein
MLNCEKCKKKLGVTYIDCRCNNKYCLKCFLPEKHNCTFDYREDNKKFLEKNLTKIDKSHNYNSLK